MIDERIKKNKNDLKNPGLGTGNSISLSLRIRIRR